MSNDMKLCIKKLAKDAILPTRANKGDAGCDLYSYEDATIEAYSKVVVGTKIAIKFPTGHYGKISSRSGLSAKNSIEVGAGTVDIAYTGEIRVVLYNHSDTPYTVKKGDRIAQLILIKISTPDIVEVEELDVTERGAGGFGSSGK